MYVYECQTNKILLCVTYYVFVYVDFIHTVYNNMSVLCMWVLWANQLPYSCVVWLLFLIIYSLRCHAAGWLCSLQLVFHFSPHLACLNKTVSILKALSFNRAIIPHKVMVATSHWTKLHQSLSTKTCSLISVRYGVNVKDTKTNVKDGWLSIFTNVILDKFDSYVNQAICTPCSTVPGLPLGSTQALFRFYPSWWTSVTGVTWGHSLLCQATGVQPGLPRRAQMKPWGWGWPLWCQQENQKSGSPRLLPAYTEHCRTQNLFLWWEKNQEELTGREKNMLKLTESTLCFYVHVCLLCRSTNSYFSHHVLTSWQ